MKKVTIILLLFIYSMSTIGVSLKEFYCCGKLQSVSVTLIHADEERCNNKDSKDDCCKSKYQLLQVKDKHFASVHPSIPYQPGVGLLSDIPTLPINSVVTQAADIINGSHAPPIVTAIPLYIVNCVFRI